LPALCEKKLVVQPRDFASSVPANTFRISSQTPRYEAGVEREVFPIGCWSTTAKR